MSDLTRFYSLLPNAFKAVHRQLKSYNLCPTLVGGVVRDFMFYGIIGKDWDIELSHDSMPFNLNQWKDLSKSFAGMGKMTFLPYNIIRLEVDGYQFEFSPPRVETFSGKSDHKNFEAEFDFKIPFKEGVLRRDFTINAMGIKLPFEGGPEFLDPLEGMKSWHEKLLVSCGPDFSKDPVRFLRALRFAQKFKLGFSSALEADLKSMDVSNFSAAYLWSEMQKSGDPLTFLRTLVEQKNKHPELRLPVNEKFLEVSELKSVLKDPHLHESWMIALEWVGLSCETWQKYFSLGSDTCQKISKWASNSKKFQQILPEMFHGEFEVVLQNPDFLLLFDWFFSTKQLLQKYPKLPLLQMIQEYLPNWIHLYKFELIKDVKHIEPPLRAKYQVWNLCQRL